MKKKLFLAMLATVMILAAGCGDEQAGEEVEVDEEVVSEEDETDVTEENGDTGEADESAGDGEVFEFNLAHFFPASHPAETELIQGWANELNEASDGRIKITSYHSGTLVGAADIYDGVVSGAADIGLSAFFYTRGRFPVLEAFELPGIVYESSYAASKVAWEGIKELEPDEVQDTKLMFVLATGPGDIFSTEPIRSLEDLQGMTIRAAGLSADTLPLLGASPEAMPMGEAYEALQRGLVDGNLAPVEVLKGWNHAEVTDYVTRTPFLYNAVFFVTMNQEKWEALPSDLQETVQEVNEQFFEDVAAGLWDAQNEEALLWAEEEMGMEIIELDEQEQERWIERVEPIQEEFIERMNQQDLPGKDIVDTVRGLAESIQ
ncbi:MAG: TRAP transporter substrate-binding protein [Bacillota bacterium]